MPVGRCGILEGETSNMGIAATAHLNGGRSVWNRASLCTKTLEVIIAGNDVAYIGIRRVRGSALRDIASRQQFGPCNYGCE
jgi:hypothetical protein